MKEQLREVLSAAEGDASWLNNAAQFFEDFAANLKAGEKAEWDLLAAVYRERAQVMQSLAEKMRQSLVGDSSPKLGSQDTSAPSS
jgi:hypothetical protein